MHRDLLARLRRHASSLVTLALCTVAAACDPAVASAPHEPVMDPPRPATTRARSPAELDTPPLWSGCAFVPGPAICEIDAAKPQLVVWIPGDSRGWTWRLDDGPLVPSSTEPADGGTRLTLPVPSASRHELSGIDPAGRPRLTLTLRPNALAPERFSWGPRVRDAIAEGTPAGRRATAVALTDDDGSPPEERLARAHWARKLAFDPRDIGGSRAGVEQQLERVDAAAMAADRLGARCDAASVGLFFATWAWDHGAAERWLPLDAECSALSPYLALLFDHYGSMLAMRRGHYSAAERRAAAAHRTARRLGHRSFEDLAASTRAEILVRTGRWARAREALDQLAESSSRGSKCRRADLQSKLGFFRLLARLRDNVDLGDPQPVLRQALALHQPGAACASKARENHDRIKLGYAAMLAQTPELLTEQLDRIDPETLAGKFPSQYHELWAHAALASGDAARAAQAIERMGTHLDPSFEPSAQWRRHMIRADVAARRRDDAGQEQAYRDAEAVLDALRPGVDDTAIRDRWLTTYRRSAHALVELLVGQDRLDDAACVARHARRRALGPLDRYEDTAAPLCERPWRHHDDEWVVLLVPRPGRGWWMFSIEDRVVDIRSLSSLPGPTALDFWDPWSPALSAHGRVRLLVSEDAFGEPLHRLAWRGQPLARTHAVTYALDLVPVPASERSGGAPAATVAFADAVPLQSLGRYRDAVHTANERLRAAGWHSTWMAGPTLDRPTLIEQLGHTDLLHYFGHGTRTQVGTPKSPTTGPTEPELAPDVLGSTALRLHDDSQLTVDDVLILGRSPRLVVLLGCQLGHADLSGFGGGLNLAHAFLLAGSEQVLAAPDPLDAAAAAQLGRSLYDDLAPNQFDLASALSRRWADLPPDSPAPLWRDLRVWVR